MIIDNSGETKPTKILRWPEVQQRVGFSKLHVVQNGQFFGEVQGTGTDIVQTEPGAEGRTDIKF